MDRKKVASVLSLKHSGIPPQRRKIQNLLDTPDVHPQKILKTLFGPDKNTSQPQSPTPNKKMAKLSLTGSYNKKIIDFTRHNEARSVSPISKNRLMTKSYQTSTDGFDRYGDMNHFASVDNDQNRFFKGT